MKNLHSLLLSLLASHYSFTSLLASHYSFTEAFVSSTTCQTSSSRRILSTKLFSSLTTAPTSDRIAHREEYDNEAFAKAFCNVEQETCYELDGDFPKDMHGTWFMNGHTKFYVSKDEFHVHPFDADGMVQAVTFSKGKAWFRNRYVQTPGYLQELKENKVCKRGVFGTARNKGKWYSNIFDVDFKNVANTHVLFMGNEELFALWEAGSPFQLNPTTLETIGESTLYGAVDGKENNRYAAHYKIDPRNKNVCGFSILPGDDDPANSHKTCVMEHNEKKELLYRKSYPFDGIGVAHDGSLTENYFVFLQSPFTFNPIPLILGLKGAAELIVMDPAAESSKICLIPRGDNNKEPISIEVPPFFSFHTSNAFEDENGEVVVDMVVARDSTNSLGSSMEKGQEGYRKAPVWETINWKVDIPANDLVRIRVDPKSGKLISKTSVTSDLATMEFPVVNPDFVSKPYTYTYCLTSSSEHDVGPFQGLAKVNVKTGQLLDKWIPESDQFLTEVNFCPKPDAKKEDDGYLLTYVMDPNKKENQVLVFDAAKPGKGPISSTKLKGWAVNPSLHGVFVPGFAPELTEQVKDSFD